MFDQESVKVWLVEEEGGVRLFQFLRVGKSIHNKPLTGKQLTNADVYCALSYIPGRYLSVQSNSSKSEPKPCAVPRVNYHTCEKLCIDTIDTIDTKSIYAYFSTHVDTHVMDTQMDSSHMSWIHKRIIHTCHGCTNG